MSERERGRAAADTAPEATARVSDPPLVDLAARLDAERRDADRRYNEALTAVDRAIQTPPAWPAPPPDYDATRLRILNEQWRVLDAAADRAGRPAPGWLSLRDRLRRFIWRIAGPPLEAQQAFNASVVDHLNRNRPVHEQGIRTAAALLAAQQAAFADLQTFQSLLVQYLQTITAYVDSKDRSLGGPEWRERLALAEQRLLALAREAGRRAEAPAAAASPASGAQRDGGSAGLPTGDAAGGASYVVFEDRFRGTPQEIRDRVARYLPVFASASDVLDVGCGRGELIQLLGEHGVSARGVDPNPAMVDVCVSRGLAVDLGDAVTYLGRQADASLGGLVSIQVVEHFDPPYLARFLALAFDKLRPGAPLVLETLNPATWMAFFDCYLRDLTHRQPLHPDTLKYLVQAAGFTSVDVAFFHPVREVDRLAPVPVPANADLAPLAAAINDHAEKLNARLFGAMDYAVVARR